MRAPLSIVALLHALPLLALGGCTGSEYGAEIALAAQGSRPLLFERTLEHAAYVVEDAQQGFWCSDVPFDALLAHERGEPLRNAVVAHVQLLWIPEAGLTPVDATATNAVVRIVVVSEGEVGLYGGAAFARPKGKPGDDEMSLEVEGGSLTLLENTKGFHDLLSPVGMSGTLRAPLAPEIASRWRRGMAQFVTNAFGRILWVRGREAPEAPGSAERPALLR